MRPKVDRIVLGSEPVPLALVRACLERFGGGVRVFNAYGAAEATITSALCEFRQSDALDQLPRAPIGRPLPGVVMDVVDAQGRPLPDGLVGELRISGPGVSQGYVRFDGEGITGPAGGVFMTGDLGRRRSDGRLEALGRRDGRAKLRGRWVSSEIVREALNGYPGVRRCAVRVDGEGARTRLVARVWPAADVAAESLREDLAVMLEARNLGQRVDLLEIAGAPAPIGWERPDQTQTAEDRVLLQLWRDVTGLTRLSTSQNLFDQGVTSLDCLALAALGRHRGLPLDVGDLYALQTIAEQAAALRLRAPAQEVLSRLPLASGALRCESQ